MPTDQEFCKHLRMTVIVIASFLFLLSAHPILAQNQNLRIGNGAVDCGTYAEVPVMFAQPDTSNVNSISMEITFPDVFQEQYVSPNDDRNRPQIFRGSVLSSGVGSTFPVIAMQVDNQGTLVPGRWRIAIMAITPPTINVPNGEILRIRFYPKIGALPSLNPINIATGLLFLSTGAQTQASTQNGTVTIFPCQANSTTTSLINPSSTSTTIVGSSTTSTTLFPITTTTGATTTTTVYTSTSTTTTIFTSTSITTTTIFTSSTTTTTTIQPGSTTTTSSPGSTTTTLPVLGPSTLLEFAQQAAGGGYRTFVYLSNPNLAAVQVAISLRNPQGNPLIVNINGLPTSSRTDTISAGGSISFRLEDSGPIAKTGWSQVYSTKPITGMAVYQYIEGGKILSEATVFPSPRIQKFVLMTPILGSASDTGLAIANPSDKSATLIMRLFNANGVQLTTSQLTLGPSEQRAQFCSQYFPGLAAYPEGMVEILSSTGIISVGLVYQSQFLVSGHDVFTTVPIIPIP